jgi:putative FmdB family regulatory protein
MKRNPPEQEMPIYEYVCDDCQAQFEKIVINKQQEISCPNCASKKATIQLSVFATAGNGSQSSSSGGSSGGGGSCCGGGCGCH